MAIAKEGIHMRYTQIDVPLALLLDPHLTASDKLLWMIMRLDKLNQCHSKKISPTKLAQRTGLSRPTICICLIRLTIAGWLVESRPRIKPKINIIHHVSMPAELLNNKELLPRDIVMYGIIQAKPFCHRKKGKFKYINLSKYANMNLKTVRRAIKALMAAHWIKVSQDNQLAPIHFELYHPRKAFCHNKIAQMKRCISVAQYYGQGVCQEIVLFLANPSEYAINYKPSWLANFNTGVLMELDLYMPNNKLALEFQGEQHFNATPFSPQEKVEKQKVRDAIKAKILADRDIKLITITDDELSVETIAQKLKDIVPLRNLEGFDSIVRFLNNCCQIHRRRIATYRKQQAATQ